MERNKNIKKIIKMILLVSGNRYFQKFYEKINEFVFLSMNIGGGANLEDSGEKFVLNYVKKNLSNTSKKIVFFDVGANIGEYSLLINKYFNKNNTDIYAFEPAGKIFNELKNNVSINNNIIINNFGIGSTDEERVLYGINKLSGLSSIYKRELSHIDMKMDVQENIKMRTIDSFCEEFKIEGIDFLKLDIEGNEYNALVGAKKLIDNKKIKYIQFEFGGCNIDSKTFFRDFFLFLNNNYKLYRILRNGITPINKYKESYEIFKTTNFFAEIRK